MVIARFEAVVVFPSFLHWLVTAIQGKPFSAITDRIFVRIFLYASEMIEGVFSFKINCLVIMSAEPLYSDKTATPFVEIFFLHS